MSIQLGQTLGSYQILRILGEGGMGTVYLARHTLLGRLAAVKVLLPELSMKEEMVARIFNEARLMAGLHHPGLVDVYDFGRHSGCAYLVMEYLEGETLAQLLDRQGKLPVELAIGLGRQIAAAVAMAHRHDIVHRDLKPDNVFLVPDEESRSGLRARLLDFGIAKLATDQSGAVRTRTGSLVGTPAYMSPEQCRGAGGAEIGPRSDVYALGCILYEMLCGRRVFSYEGLGELIAAQLYEIPAEPRAIDPSIPEWLDALMMRCLAKAPNERPASMEEIVRHLGSTGSGVRPGENAPPSRGRTPTTLGRLAGEAVTPQPTRRRWGRWLVAGAALAALAAGGLAWSSMTSPDRAAAKPPAAPPPPLAVAVAATPDAAVASSPPDAAVPTVDATVTVDAAAPPPRRPLRPRAKPAPAPAPPKPTGTTVIDPYAEKP
jgi:serine/threonine-protein kinase